MKKQSIYSDKGVLILLIIALLLTFAVRLAWFARTGNHEFWADELTYDKIAQNLIHGNGFCIDEGKLTGFVGPTYPALVAAIYWLSHGNPQPIYILQILLSVFTGYLIYRIGILLIGSRMLSVLAVFMFALYFPLIQQTTILVTETFFTFLLASMLLTIIIGLQKKSMWLFVLAGLIAGITALCRPIVLAYPAVVFIGALVAFRQSWKQIFLSILLFTICMLAAIMPWTYRNYRIWHTLVPVATEGGYVFWAGNYGRDGEFTTFTHEFPPHIRQFLDTHPTEAEKNSFFVREAVKNIKANPKHFMTLAGRKFLRTWFNVGYADKPSKASIALMFGHIVLLIFSGFSLKMVKNRGALAVIIAMMALTTAVHMLTFGNVRYVLPLMPYVMLLAVYGCSGFMPRLSKLD